MKNIRFKLRFWITVTVTLFLITTAEGLMAWEVKDVVGFGKAEKDIAGINTELRNVDHDRCCAFSDFAADQTLIEPGSSGIVGDMDGDGDVDRSDSEFLVGYFAGWHSNIDINVGDIDRNGFLNRLDAMLLARYIDGWNGYEVFFKKESLLVESVEFHREGDLVHVQVIFSEILKDRVFTFFLLHEKVEPVSALAVNDILHLDQLSYIEDSVYEFTVDVSQMEIGEEAPGLGNILYIVIGCSELEQPEVQMVILAD